MKYKIKTTFKHGGTDTYTVDSKARLERQKGFLGSKQMKPYVKNVKITSIPIVKKKKRRML